MQTGVKNAISQHQPSEKKGLGSTDPEPKHCTLPEDVAGGMLPSPRWKGPTLLFSGKGASPEAKSHAEVPRHPREPHGGPKRSRRGTEGQQAQRPGRAAGPAGLASPARKPARGRAAAPPQGRKGREAEGRGAGTPRAARPPALTVDVLPVADVLQVAARVLPAQLGLRAVGLQPGVGIPAQLGAGGDAAGCGVPHLLGPAPARPGSGGGEGRPVSRGGGKPWAAAETTGSGGGRGGCGALRLHSPADPHGGSSAEAAPQRGPPAWAAAAKPSSAGRQRGARRVTAPSPPAGPPRSAPAPAQPPGPLHARTHAAAPQPPRQRQPQRQQQRQPPRAAPANRFRFKRAVTPPAERWPWPCLLPGAAPGARPRRGLTARWPWGRPRRRGGCGPLRLCGLPAGPQPCRCASPVTPHTYSVFCSICGQRTLFARGGERGAAAAAAAPGAERLAPPARKARGWERRRPPLRCCCPGGERCRGSAPFPAPQPGIAPRRTPARWRRHLRPGPESTVARATADARAEQAARSHQREVFTGAS